MRLCAALTLSMALSSGAVSAGTAPAKPLPRPALPRMKLEAQYAGPLQDTIIQRLRDPVDGTICYVYLPIAVKHEPSPTGFVQYGSNAIGSISCVPPK
jgi:hypothetical protein